MVTPSRTWGWLYFAIGAIGSLVWAAWTDASSSLSTQAGLWLSSGLFMLLAAFVLEPWYSGSGTTVTNSLLVIVGVVAANPGAFRSWWYLLLGVAVLAFAMMAAAALLDSRIGSPARRQLERAGRSLGSWRVLPFGLMILSLVTFNEPGSDEWSIGAAIAVYSFGVSRFRPENLVWPTRKTSAVQLPGILAPPSEAVLIGGHEQGLSLNIGDRLLLRTAAGDTEALVVAPVVADGLASWQIFAPDLRSILRNRGHIDGDRVTFTVELASEPAAELAPWVDALADEDAELLGVTAEGSGIADVQVDVTPGVSIDVGDLFCTYRAGRRVFWQVSDAAVVANTWPEGRHRTIRVAAGQLGAWDPTRCRFERSTAAPSVGELAIRSPTASEAEALLPTGAHVRIGSIPGSHYPVAVDPALLGRHHAAILGVTGTGKTHLSFALVDALGSCGTRVLCGDLTGQYADRYPSAPTVRYSDVDDFLGDETKGPIGVCDFTTSSASPVTQASMLIQKIYGHVKGLPRLDPDQPARFVVVLEEAHNFIPEAFVINDWDLKAEAQATSKVFMEARKFGLGFIVITQRTAMITKSALSQCGSLFVFQTVDQTGQDYLEGLCGRARVKSLPLLPDRTALALGRAVSADSALLMAVDQATTVIT